MQSKSVLISRFTLQISILQSISSFAVSYVFAKFFATTFASKFEIFLAIDAGYFFVLLFLTLLARYGAYFLNYEDGKQLFEHFFLIFLLLLL